MVLRRIYSRAEKIQRGKYPNANLKVSGPPGETVRQVWVDYISKPKINNKPHLLSRLINYVRRKLTGDSIDPRDEIINGLENRL